MKINVREGHVEIEGYVNAIERLSKPLLSRVGRFVEKICKGATSESSMKHDSAILVFACTDRKQIHAGWSCLLVALSASVQ